MPRYTIDTDDGHKFIEGDEEISFRCPYRARAAADEVVGGMADDALPDGEPRVLRAIVRDELGREVYVASATLVGEWKIPQAAL